MLAKHDKSPTLNLNSAMPDISIQSILQAFTRYMMTGVREAFTEEEPEVPGRTPVCPTRDQIAHAYTTTELAIGERATVAGKDFHTRQLKVDAGRKHTRDG